MSIARLYKEVTENGLPEEHAVELRSIVNEHNNMFRTTFSAGPPAYVPPLEVKLSQDARPVRLSLRNYSLEQRDFLKRHVADL